MQIIEDMAIVKEVRGREVLVELPKSESCDSCAVHGFCHQNDTPRQHWIKTDIELKAGDHVRIFLAPALKITSSIIVFLLPVVIMLAFYLIPKYVFSSSEDIAILVSILSLGVSGIVIYYLDKSWGKKIRFDIIEKLSISEEEKNEDQAK